jgi:alpha-ketoglutarate-dependent 2,4-dichlorophenoxyacetate dioxygenase
MALQFRRLHPTFVAEVSPVDLRQVHDAETLAEIRAGMDTYALLVFRDQPFADDQQIAFAQRLDGQLHTKTGTAALGMNRLGNDALADISNLDEQGDISPADNRRRAYGLGNRLWHTDASFQDPAGRYSMLSAKVIPPVGADTEYADMRAAYDTLPAETKARLEGLRVHHSIAYSRQMLGFEFSPEEAGRLEGAVHPLVRVIPRSHRRSLYLASHASRIIAPRGATAPPRPHRARDPAPVRLPAPLGRRRSRHLGQSRHDASRAPLRRHAPPAGAPPRDDARHRAGRGADRPLLTGRAGAGPAGGPVGAVEIEP